MANRAVEVAIDAEPELVPVVRNVAADLAIRMDLRLDTIADLRLAVDEACALLLSHAAASTMLRCRFTLGEGTVTARVEIPCRPDTAIREEGFNWHVLRALVQSVHSTRTVRETDGIAVAVIELVVADL